MDSMPWLGWGMGWMMLWMGLAGLAGLALLGVAVVLLVRWLGGPPRAAAQGADPALQEARLRLARGELTVEEYERIVAKLRESSRGGAG